jgi:BirA family biotin operon repressor/biotin-[acetyl-CoA-carboxylase] ligase
MKNFDDLLNPYYIRDSLPIESKLLTPVIQVFENTSSTNNILMEKNCVYPNGHTCFAENQTCGRGLSNKSWVSTEKNVCFSVAWNFEKTLRMPHMLNYFIAIKLAKELHKKGFKKISTKWPNDLVFEGAKIGGILIDSVHRKDSKIYLVVGVGLNIKVSHDDKKNIDQDVAGLSSIKKNLSLSRSEIAAILLNAVLESLSEFELCDFKNLSEDWNNIDYNYNKLKTIMIGNEKIKTTLMGINEFGQFCCFHDNKINLYEYNEVKITKI